MVSTASSLRQRIQSLPKGARRRYPQQLRDDIIAFVVHACGATRGSVARRAVEHLGLHWTTYVNWLDDEDEESGDEGPRARETLGPVAVRVRTAPGVSLMPSGGDLVVTSPTGYKVGGLGLEQVVTLLGALEGR